MIFKLHLLSRKKAMMYTSMSLSYCQLMRRSIWFQYLWLMRAEWSTEWLEYLLEGVPALICSFIVCRSLHCNPMWSQKKLHWPFLFAVLNLWTSEYMFCSSKRIPLLWQGTSSDSYAWHFQCQMLTFPPFHSHRKILEHCVSPSTIWVLIIVEVCQIELWIVVSQPW